MNARTSFFAIALTLCAVGCGGGSGSGSGSNNNNGPTTVPGLYHAAYNRASGNLTIGIDDQGNVGVIVLDTLEQIFVGSGSAKDGAFSVLCNGLNSRTVIVSGTTTGSGSQAHVNGSIAGIVAADYTADYTAAPSITDFTKHYVGTFTGGQDGIVVGAVDQSGHFTGTISYEHEATVLLDGTVSATGYMSVSGSSANAEFSLKGMLDASNATQVTGNGLWTSPSLGAGTFTLSETSTFTATR